MAVSGDGQGGGGDVAVGGDGEVDGLGTAGGGRVGLGELVVRGGEADPEPFGLAGPAFAFCLGDACGEAGADVAEPNPDDSCGRRAGLGPRLNR